MSEGVRVEFLGWDEPGLATAAARLCEAGLEGQEVRLDGAVVVVPGARAGRRLGELLVERSEGMGAALWPGRIVTIGALPELMFRSERRRATAAARLLGWVEALRGLDVGTLGAVVPHPPGEADAGGWLALAERVQGLHETLAGAGVRFGAVGGLAEASGLADFAEHERWSALEAAASRHREAMAEAGVVDRQEARLEAMEALSARGPGAVGFGLEGRLWLVGVAEMPTLARRMIEAEGLRRPGSVCALVQAPAELADRFDGLGTVVPERWAEARIELGGARLRVAEGPAGQAGAAARAIVEASRGSGGSGGSGEGGGGRYGADEITVGVCDGEVMPHVKRQLAALGVPAREAAGRPVGRCGPARLLEAAAAYLSGRRFGDFAALVRHPAAAAWLAERLTAEGAGGGVDGREEAEVGVDAWLGWMDAYHNEHLQERLTASWLGEGGRAERMRRVYEAVHGPGLLGGLEGRRRYSDWAEAIGSMLGSVYGGSPLDRGDEAERPTIESCEAIGSALEELARLPVSLDAEVEAWEAIGLVLRLVEGATVAPGGETAAVELLGWLELALDDAPCMIVTGFNEGRAPESVVGDAFLPDGLRSALGLIDNARRYARDAYAASAIVGCRSGATLVAGRRAADGEPLLPSRLWFAEDREVVVARARWFYESEPEVEASGASAGAGPGAFGEVGEAEGVFEALGKWPPPPPRDVRPPTAMAVTAFRDYLACPYRFYLRHVLGLRPVDDRAMELDGAGFGGLLHEVVRRFGAAAMAGEVEAGEEAAVRAWVWDALDGRFAERFGARPPAALRVQREQLRARLADFARWQAGWHAAGHRIEAVELPVDDAALVVDGEAMGLRGRIDRIDVHVESGARLLLDYKTGETARKPDQTHRRGAGAGREWVDLQLPLYRVLAAAREIGPIGGVGYVNLPRASGGAGEALADWGEAELSEAMATAEAVVRGVRACEFYPPAEAAPAFDDYAAICGTEPLVLGADDDDDDEASGAAGGSGGKGDRA